MLKRAAGTAGALASAAFATAVLVGVSPSGAAPRSTPASSRAHFLRVCGTPAPGTAACHALLNTDLSHTGGSHPSKHPTTTSTTLATTTTTNGTTSTTLATTTTQATTTTTAPTTTTTTGGSPPPPGYGPADLRGAYGLAGASVSNGAGQTVAIVDAYNDPNAEADLGVYRAQFALPPCTTANGCFRKVNQNGVAGSYPSNSASWSQEISLDLDMVSAICPNCKILLVEASSASFSALGTAEDQAVALGATEISNSWGGQSSFGTDLPDSSYGTYFNHPGVAITASSGDGGYGVEYPASSAYVTAVGGTSLVRSTNLRGWAETAWSGAGSGCSYYNGQPSWQLGVVSSKCGLRAVADVAADADPKTGVAVYDSYSYQGFSGWLVFGGTSVASPVIASVYALAGNASQVDYGSYPYSHRSALFDVSSGSNGSCGGDSLCNAGPGWDGPTGLGTPDGTGGF